MGEFSDGRPPSLWRRHCDAVNGALIERWLAEVESGWALKTDLFDEAAGEGLFPLLDARFARVTGIDVSASLVTAARERYPRFETVRADVRKLPFPDEELDAVVSMSTLDHFSSRKDIAAALRELHRVLGPRGRLVLTLDNLAKPAVAVRNALPFSLLNRIGLVPYEVGATAGPRELRRLLASTGFDVVETSAILHCPRATAVALARLIERRGQRRLEERFLRMLRVFERLERAPTRCRTGYFLAVLARRAD